MSAQERPLRIAFIDSWLQTAMEGSGTAVGINGLQAALQRRGHHITRIAPPPPRSQGFLALVAHRLRFNLGLPAHFRASAYDLVVGFDIDGFALQWSNQPAQPPYICSIKGIIAEELLHERGLVRVIFTRLAQIEGRNARRAALVSATSRYCRDRIVEHYGVAPERIAIIPEGIDLGSWQAALESAPPRCTAAPTILCVARQYPRKHVADLIRAFGLIRERAPTARLRIVGDGPEHANLQQLVAMLGLGERVVLLGGLSDDAVKREYAQADVFCLPSVQEGFGIVFLEAMAAGLPVVATRAAAIPETVRHGETGILVAPGDVRGLAGALLLLLHDRDRRERYGNAGRALVAAYDWSRIAEMFLQTVGPLVR